MPGLYFSSLAIRVESRNVVDRSGLLSNYKKLLFIGLLFALIPTIQKFQHWFDRSDHRRVDTPSGEGLVVDLPEGGEPEVANSRMQPDEDRNHEREVECAKPMSNPSPLDLNLIHIVGQTRAVDQPINLDADRVSALELYGIWLSTMRRRKEISLQEMEKRTGIEAASLLRIETGQTALPQVLDALPAIAAALDEDRVLLERRLTALLFDFIEEESQAFDQVE